MSTISASTTTTTAFRITTDTAGTLVFQTGSTPTTAVTIDTSQRVAFVAGTAAAPAITTTGDTDTGIFFPAANTLAFSTNGTEDARFDSAGNFGLGVTPSAWLTSSNYKAIELGRVGNCIVSLNDSDIQVRSNSYLNSSGVSTYAANGFAANYEQYRGVHYWLTAPSGTAGNPVTFSQSMILDNSGNLLVGTTTATGKLTVSDPVDRTQATAQFSVSGNGYTAHHFLDATAYYIGQNSSIRVLRMYSGGSSGTGVQLSAGGTSWGTYSDERIKTGLTPIENALSKVNTLRAVTGRYNTDEDTVSRAFLIAQDVQAVLPEAVDEDNDEQKTLTLKYTEVIPLLVAAIKEQQAIIEQMQTRLTALEPK
jgi:hypothetical protein